MLPEAQVKEIAREVNISPAAVRRLLGTLSIPSAGANPESERPAPPLNLGLRLDQLRKEGIFTPYNTSELGRILVEYRTSCPAVFAWIVNGGFDPTKSPSTVTRGNLVHATRTAGRLRAKYLRA